MGNEMGNNNTSEFREEEKAKAEGPEKSLLEGGVNEVEADEVTDFRQKEAWSGSDGADRLNGDHHVTDKEEEKDKPCNTAEFQVVSELPDRTIEDNEVQAKPKEDKEMMFDSEENRSDGNEREHEKQASNQKEKEGERSSNVNKTILALDEPKLEKISDLKNNQHGLLDIKAESSVEDSKISPEESKDALELSLNNTCHSADLAMADSEETTNMDQVIDTNRETNKKNNGEKGNGSNSHLITRASEDPKSEKVSDFVMDQVIDTNLDACKENDGGRGNDSNLDMMTHVSEDPKSEKTSDLDIDQVIDTNRDTDKEKDGEMGKGSNFDTITQASEDPKSEETLEVGTDRDTDKENDEERGKGSNLDPIKQPSEEPESEKTSNVKSIQNELPETKAESLVGSRIDGSSQESKYGLGFSLKHTADDGHVMYTEKSTNVDSINTEPDTGVEKKQGDLIEPRSRHEYAIPAAKYVDTKDEEAATDLISHNSCSPPEESLVIESPKSSMQVPDVEDRCTVLKEESQLRESHLGTETVVQENIPTQSKISNGVQEEFNNAVETEVSAESVAENKNQNEAPGEDSEDSDGEYLEISEQGMAILTLSIGDCKQKNEDMGETMEISTNNGHVAERREPEESLFEPILWFQPQIHQKENSITFQTTESTDESISAPRQETKTAIEKSERKASDSPHYIQAASVTSTETKPSTKTIDEQSATTLPFSTSREEDQESPGRTSNESNSDNSTGHIEMRKSPSFNIDIQSEERAGETEKIPLLYQIKAMEELQNLQDISFPNPMEKRVVKLGRSDSEKSRPSFPGFAKEIEESEMEFKSIDQNSLAADKKAMKDFPTPSPIRKGKRRTKSLIFGTCICCATAIN